MARKPIELSLTVYDNTIIYSTHSKRNNNGKYTIKRWNNLNCYGQHVDGVCMYTDYCGAVIESVAERIAYRAVIKLYAWSDSESADKFRIMADDIIRMHDANSNITDSDAFDIIQNVKLAILLLVNNGLVNKPSDINQYRSVIYKLVNRYAREQARDYSQTAHANDEDDHGNTVFDVPFFDAFGDVENAVFLEAFIPALERFLMANLSSHVKNKRKVVDAVIMVNLQGYTQEQTANILNVEQSQIVRYLKYAKKCIRENGRAFAIECLY